MINRFRVEDSGAQPCHGGGDPVSLSLVGAWNRALASLPRHGNSPDYLLVQGFFEVHAACGALRFA